MAEVEWVRDTWYGLHGLSLITAVFTIAYLILLLYIFRHLERIKPFQPVTEPSTFVSVVIACKNEQENLPDLLTRLSRQDYPDRLYEVIIVDDHSSDKTTDVVRSYSSNLNLKLMSNEGTGKKHALRKGIECANGDFIITTDADCSPSQSWIRVIASFFERYKADLIIAPVQLRGEKTFFGRFQELEFLSLQGITAGTASANKAVMCNGANLAFTKKAYSDNADNLRFDIPTGDDIFLLHSIKKQKSAILWLESVAAIIVTEAAPGLISFLKQRRRWASKSTSYRDGDSILLGIVTFVTNLALVVSLSVSVLDPHYLYGFGAIFIIKSIPDYLILNNVAVRYGRRNLMKWFLPCQIIYPFYVLIVAVFALYSKTGWRISYPSRKGI